MSLRAEHPLTFALGCLVGAVGVAYSLIGADVFAHVMHWRTQLR